MGVVMVVVRRVDAGTVDGEGTYWWCLLGFLMAVFD